MVVGLKSKKLLFSPTDDNDDAVDVAVFADDDDELTMNGFFDGIALFVARSFST
jgi:hypothetical protein